MYDVYILCYEQERLFEPRNLRLTDINLPKKKLLTDNLQWSARNCSMCKHDLIVKSPLESTTVFGNRASRYFAHTRSPWDLLLWSWVTEESSVQEKLKKTSGAVATSAVIALLGSTNIHLTLASQKLASFLTHVKRYTGFAKACIDIVRRVWTEDWSTHRESSSLDFSLTSQEEEECVWVLCDLMAARAYLSLMRLHEDALVRLELPHSCKQFCLSLPSAFSNIRHNKVMTVLKALTSWLCLSNIALL